MNNRNTPILQVPYTPVRIGSWHDQAKMSVYGMAYDHTNSLIALSVMGAQIGVEQIHYKSQGQEYSFSLNPASGYGWMRHARTHKAHYEILKVPIPDSSDVSMIMLNDSLFKISKDMDFTHVWYYNAEAFKEELWQRVAQIVYIPVLPEWGSYLVTHGMAKEINRRAMCGRLVNAADDRYNWMCAGFDIGFILNDREAWTKLISDGLNKKLIRLEEGDNLSVPEMIIPQSRAMLYREDGDSQLIDPINLTDFKLDQLYEVLECDTVEMVYLDGKEVMLIDEEGKFSKDYNDKATEIFRKHHPDSRDYIVGNAIVCPDDMFQ